MNKVHTSTIPVNANRCLRVNCSARGQGGKQQDGMASQRTPVLIASDEDGQRKQKKQAGDGCKDIAVAGDQAKAFLLTNCLSVEFGGHDFAEPVHVSCRKYPGINGIFKVRFCELHSLCEVL